MVYCGVLTVVYNKNLNKLGIYPFWVQTVFDYHAAFRNLSL